MVFIKRCVILVRLHSSFFGIIIKVCFREEAPKDAISSVVGTAATNKTYAPKGQ